MEVQLVFLLTSMVLCAISFAAAFAALCFWVIYQNRSEHTPLFEPIYALIAVMVIVIIFSNTMIYTLALFFLQLITPYWNAALS